MTQSIKCCATLCKGLEQPQISVSAAGPGTHPPQIPRDDCIRKSFRTPPVYSVFLGRWLRVGRCANHTAGIPFLFIPMLWGGCWFTHHVDEELKAGSGGHMPRCGGWSWPSSPGQPSHHWADCTGFGLGLPTLPTPWIIPDFSECYAWCGLLGCQHLIPRIIFVSFLKILFTLTNVQPLHVGRRRGIQVIGTLWDMGVHCLLPW